MSTIKTSSFRPIGAQILVRVAKQPTESNLGGIIVPTKNDGPVEGVVEALGSGRRNERGEYAPFEVKAGDRVLFARYGGVEVKIGDNSFTLVTEDNILGILS